jgi:hypothetical protein
MNGAVAIGLQSPKGPKFRADQPGIWPQEGPNAHLGVLTTPRLAAFNYSSILVLNQHHVILRVMLTRMMLSVTDL